MRLFRILTLIVVVCLSVSFALVGQVYAASDGCVALNSRPADSTTIPGTTGMDGGTISLGTYDFTAGEVITVSADSRLSGGVALQAEAGGNYASALLPNSAVYTIPVSGTYAFRMYFDVSNHTAGPVPSKPTVSCGGVGGTDNRNVSLPNAAVYINADGIFVASTTNLGEGAFVSLSPDQIAELPAEVGENTLLSSSGDGFVSLYLLTTGEFQINIGPDQGGNVAVIIFTGVPPTNMYRRDFNVNDILYP
jgi:hypothetical protein